ncbi:putative RST domain of plant protein [Helianthus annuus]|uniref:RST domain of plant protein n=2 Tax=Helianthus annuus TaxID=4232 RepID=A0A9K3DP24_HELAN|nr:putative RST domain of plant protein [Helianthus annuus]KAJ0430928.1 putative RST domain-containing protein [Helianthus annuus]KAJ0634242.1 putative RST domain-containing protein [Helianthus annuus]KAJ0815240.1 putative RST domain of plant protein [Helianthus annuus]
MDLTTGMQNADKNPAQNVVQTPEDESQFQRMGNQQAMATGQPPNAMRRPAGKQVPFALMLPVLEAQLDKDQAMQLQGLCVRLKSNKFNKEEFFRHLRSLVGDHMLKMAVYKLQQRQLTALGTRLQASQMSFYLNAVKQETDEPIHSQTAFSDMKRLHGRDLAHFASNSGKPSLHNNKNLTSLHNDQNVMSLLDDQFYTSLLPYAKQEPLYKSQLSAPQGLSSFSPGQIESSKNETFGMMSSKPGFLKSMNKPEPMSITAQLKRLNVSAGNCSLPSGSNAKTSPKKPTIGQKKMLEAPVSSLR